MCHAAALKLGAEVNERKNIPNLQAVRVLGMIEASIGIVDDEDTKRQWVPDHYMSSDVSLGCDVLPLPDDLGMRGKQFWYGVERYIQ